MADRLTKKAATNDTGELVYDKIPYLSIILEGKENEITKCHEQCKL